ncbi:MAG: prepilin-type N-terminal cleavage/methylation domain-containing protein [Candidatus Taylorbacteria bacterium]|nr:prepilin-type N-terminal cleavage/methylation domain-containing protein [Candidatus Taylorbacteria bacterium]
MNKESRAGKKIAGRKALLLFTAFSSKSAIGPRRGFTLIEAMVAISILSLAITGPLIIAQKGVGSAIYARDQITAFYLAQEAVEYVRNIRDSNRITNTSWLNPLTACKDTGLGERCAIDARYTDFTNPNAVTSCPSGVCPALSFDNANSVYGYCSGSCSTWRTTPFTRTVSIDDRASSKEAAVSVTVSWTTTLFTPLKTFTVKEYMFNF